MTKKRMQFYAILFCFNDLNKNKPNKRKNNNTQRSRKQKHLTLATLCSKQRAWSVCLQHLRYSQQAHRCLFPVFLAPESFFWNSAERQRLPK